LVSPEIAALSAIKGYLSEEFEDDMYLDEVPSTPFIKNTNFFINDYDPNTESKIVKYTEIPDDWEGFDIGTETIEIY